MLHPENMLSLCRIPCPPDYLQQRRKEGRKRLIHVFCSQVSATFAASLVTSPAIGAYLSQAYGDTLVVVLASGVALLDIGFILLAVPESLPEEMRPVSWGAPISWEQADPFAVSHPLLFCRGQVTLVFALVLLIVLQRKASSARGTPGRDGVQAAHLQSSGAAP